MKVLSPTELYLLTLADGPVEMEPPPGIYPHMFKKLATSGYVVTTHEPNGGYTVTTPQGRLAIRCHRALLGAST